MRSAVIDAGYNSFRISVYDVFPNGSFRLIGSFKKFVRIGEGIQEGGVIPENKIKEAEETFLKFKKIIEVKNVKDVRAVGTSAFRYALNGSEVSQRLSDILGYDFRIISGEEEGMMSAIGVMNTLPVIDGIIFEIGGGSLELAEILQRNVKKIVSLPIGALKLINYSEREIRNKVRNELLTVSFKSNFLIGSGGNMRAIAKLDEKLSGFPSDSIHGYLISSKQINKYSKVLYSLDPEERASLPGISKDRAFTIHTASIIIDELVQYFNAEYIMVSAFGMREGVLTKDKVIDRNKWLESIAYSYQIDPPWDIYREVERVSKGEMGFYVGASAFILSVLRMSGFINYYDACYKLLRNALIPGFTQNELLLISLICKSAKGKIKKKLAKYLGIKRKELEYYGNVIKNILDELPLGVKI